MNKLNRAPSRTGGMLRSALPTGMRRDREPGELNYLPLIQKLVELRQEQSAGVITAFTAASRRQGVTYVVESLAWQLSQHTGEPILLTSGIDLAAAARTAFWEPQRIQRLTGGWSHEPVFDTPSWEDMQILRGKFGFVLLDCPALCESSEVLALAKLVDGVALVIAAGETRRDEIESAQNALDVSGATVLGLILNKRTNPVPRLLSKLL